MQITPRLVQQLSQALALMMFGALGILDFDASFVTAPFFAPSLFDLYFGAAFILTVLVYVSFPRSRRFDLTLFMSFAISLLTVLTAAIRAKTGFPVPLHIVATRAMEFAGVFAAYLPGYAERLRYLRRTQAFRGFGDIAASDRRRSARAARIRHLGEDTFIQRGGIWARRTGQSQRD